MLWRRVRPLGPATNGTGVRQDTVLQNRYNQADCKFFGKNSGSGAARWVTEPSEENLRTERYWTHVPKTAKAWYSRLAFGAGYMYVVG